MDDTDFLLAPAIPAGFASQYVDRSREIRLLNDLVAGSRPTRFVALVGGSGYGKTWIAKQFGIRMQDFFDHVLYVDLEGLSDVHSIETEKALRASRSGRTLLILDGFTGADEYVSADPFLMIPATTALVVGRRDGEDTWNIPRSIPDRVDVPILTLAQAAELVNKILGSDVEKAPIDRIYGDLHGNVREIANALRLFRQREDSWDSLLRSVRDQGDGYRTALRENIPLIQVIPNVTPELLKFLAEDPEHFRQITPQKFEEFAADRLERMGYTVTLAGHSFRKDGGVDIVATKKDPVLGEFVIAGQVKHHKGDRKTGREAIDRLISLKGGVFSFGVLVTNTSFTHDARWVASKAENRWFAKLRDIEDLKLWLEDNFASERENRLMPDRIELAPGVWITVPRVR